MKIKFVLLSLFVGANVATSMALKNDDHGNSPGGGILNQLKSVYEDDSSSATEVRIVNRVGQEVARIAIDDLDFTMQNLTSGAYNIIYINSSGDIISQFYFVVE